MKIRHVALLAAGALAAYSLAAPPTTQWRPIPESMFDLAQQGYKEFSVIQAAPPKNKLVFYLQKGTSIAYCVESYGEGIRFRCYQLVKPQASLH